MKSRGKYVTFLVLLLAAMFTVTACQETAARFTDRAIENMEDEVGGAAERSSQRAGDQAGGEICGAPLALALLLIGMPGIALIRKDSTRITKQKGLRIVESRGQRIRGDGKLKKAENDDNYSD